MAMTARRAACPCALLLAGALCLGSAQARAADMPRYAPPVGLTYSYQIEIDTFLNDKQIVADTTVYQRRVIASDGPESSALNTIRAMSGRRVDRLTPGEKTLYMALLSGYFAQDSTYFLATRLTNPTWPLTDESGDHLPSPQTFAIYYGRFTCDDAALARFFPIGRITQVTVPCQSGIHVVRMDDTLPDRPPEPVDLTISYEGDSTTTLDGKVVPVRRLRSLYVFATGLRIDTRQMFSEQYGITLHSDSTQERRNGDTVFRAVSHADVLRIDQAAD